MRLSKSPFEGDRSVTSSPVRHIIRTLSTEKELNQSYMNRRTQPKIRDNGLNFNPAEHNKEEKMFEIHNANGHFACNCDVCLA